jgi:hypothetical protein
MQKSKDKKNMPEFSIEDVLNFIENKGMDTHDK